MSLARGPALILGTILLAVGLYLLYKARTFPPFSNFPNGDVTKDGDFLFGLFGANGWTAMLTAVGGGLLLFGAAQHLLAKTMSLVVGVALGAAAVIALISGNVLGMAAANGWTKLGWAVCAVILLFNTLVPRRRRTVVVAEEPVVNDAAAYDRRPTTAAEEDAVAAHEEPTVAHRERVVDEEPTVAHRDHVVDEEPTAAHRDRVVEQEPTAVRHGDEPADMRRD
jgi:apolipoprotein N-acyltransferase